MSLLIAFHTDLSSPKLPSWVMSRKVHSCSACVRTASSVHMSVWVLKTACAFLLLIWCPIQIGAKFRSKCSSDKRRQTRNTLMVVLHFLFRKVIKNKCITIPSSLLHNNLITLQTGKICFTNPALLH